MRSEKVCWRDLWIVPLYFVLSFLLPFIFAIIYTLTHPVDINHIEQEIPESLFIYSSLISLALVLLTYYLMHIKGFFTRSINGIKSVKHFVLLIIIGYLGIMAYNMFSGWFMELMPEHLQVKDSLNQQLIEQSFEERSLWPALFVDIVLLAPIIEELIFRHVLIGELGKKLNFKVMSVVSVIGFTALHVIGGTSPLEFIFYIGMAAIIVYVYNKSGRNLAISIALHMLNNFISYIIIIFEQLLS
ncbi:CPBP family intramembrane glutamic endopeptidase [Staphylococcus massiliensis]|uniref:Metal-dependent membrane protease n=1 Tax=Staphylococcus massiliensis S46 TaxID=1229783 RepID=K9B0Z5_9STAP|nr:type II CAAX endopeptidase family protein [Staphylococcus massiliensis]EKU47450.1 metal-dependent membrane protease [Staphylococcus massiliensis S46]MCG3400366.1 CPBP family intramembrane metalloprotease [Staphylococcus massiliensis]MCG3401941.1 CPBP family intramembrane metalloprotease [Staphylococcus massiliensis]MCG3412396.1 CPBP family intramembrane metalloprotease [Staphylococcus massiliensis]POA01447.1 CPBP family intramembrane metalloprotease [Staphylococcus massiliensis CCUG 55927]